MREERISHQADFFQAQLGEVGALCNEGFNACDVEARRLGDEEARQLWAFAFEELDPCGDAHEEGAKKFDALEMRETVAPVFDRCAFDQAAIIQSERFEVWVEGSQGAKSVRLEV